MSVEGAVTTRPAAPAVARAAGFGHDVIEAACRAPSLHNSQPWSWRAGGSTVELYADHARRLTHADPNGRMLLISCGAALHHAQVAARGLGWRPEVARWPGGTSSDLLARVTLGPDRRTAEDVALLRALHERRTDRRRFTSWPVQGDRLERLVQVAAAHGCEAVSLTSVVDRYRVEHLLARAYATQAADAGLRDEHRRWTDHSVEDGVPADVVPSGADTAASRRPRFPDGALEDREHHIETTDGVVVLCAATDDPPAWLAVGEALSAVWLSAVLDGLSVVPLSQVVEVASTRASLQHEVLMGLAVPHLVLRVGWQPISRGPLRRTPRRPVADVVRG